MLTTVSSFMGAIGTKEMTDLEVIQIYLKTQEPSYFNILYKRYSVKVYSKSISLLKEEAWAKDATQEIFIKIFLNLSKFGAQSKFSTWVYSITYNFCIDLIRKKKKMKNVFSDEIENAPDLIDDVPDEALLTMEVSRLKNVLNHIPVGDKAILLMKYQEEMQIKEIAVALEKTESAIKMKIKRAKHKSQQVYKSLYKD